ncbi:hypothetical protein ACNKHK_21710 [Shigella flexneri]
MDITLKRLTRSRRISMLPTLGNDLAGHTEASHVMPNGCSLFNLNLSRLLTAMEPNDCLVVMANSRQQSDHGHSHHTREVVRYWCINRGWSLRN